MEACDRVQLRDIAVVENNIITYVKRFKFYDGLLNHSARRVDTNNAPITWTQDLNSFNGQSCGTTAYHEDGIIRL